MLAPNSFNVQKAFTLIELSIVLVIIGLIVGGVLVGRDLIRAAEIRGTVAQIEKYNTAVNTFRGKYGALPGDLNATAATQFGFTARGTLAGQGDGNGNLEGAFPGLHCGNCEGEGETIMFWVDLTTANGLNINLIEGSFNSATPTTLSGALTTASQLERYFPVPKIGMGNYIYAFGGGYFSGAWYHSGINYFGISTISLVNGGNGTITTNPGLRVADAASIDQKMDDGLPQSGNVQAMYLNQNVGTASAVWAASGGVQGANGGGTPAIPSTAATPGSATTCYDNGNAAGAPQRYSVAQSGGVNINCALSFAFQ